MHYDIFKRLITLNAQNLDHTNHLYASTIKFCMVKYNLNALRDYGTNLELLESENINIKTLFEK